MLQLVTEEVAALQNAPPTQYLAEKICLLLLLQPPSAWPPCWAADPLQERCFLDLMDASSQDIAQARHHTFPSLLAQPA